MRKETHFLVKTYSKSELAHLYSPEIPVCAALRLLKSCIEHNRELNEKLRATGYKTRNRYFCPRQVELIREHLGEP